MSLSLQKNKCVQCGEEYELENHEFIFGSICHVCGKFQKVYRETTQYKDGML